MFFSGLAAFLNKVIEICGSAVSLLTSLLPSSPFNFVIDSQFSELIGKINYFIPIYEFVSILELWIVAVAAYYLYSVFARWIRAIE